MPKLPRTSAEPGATTAAKATAKPAKPASDGKSSAATKRRTAVKRKARQDGAAGDRDFERHPVDEHTRHAPAGPKAKLTEDQRVLLGDLFAVVEEHAEEAAERVDRGLVERAFGFACERHAEQRRASGE